MVMKLLLISVLAVVGVANCNGSDSDASDRKPPPPPPASRLMQEDAIPVTVPGDPPTVVVRGARAQWPRDEEPDNEPNVRLHFSPSLPMFVVER